MSKKQKQLRKAPQFPLSQAAMVEAEVEPVEVAIAAPIAKEPKVKKEKVLRPCLCGCGAMVPRKFKQGHDARLKGYLQRAHANVPHPNDGKVPALIALFEQVTGAKIANRTAMGLAEAISPKWPRFLTEYRQPGSRKVA